MELGNLPGKEFGVVTVKMIKEIDTKSEKLKVFNKEKIYRTPKQR